MPRKQYASAKRGFSTIALLASAIARSQSSLFPWAVARTRKDQASLGSSRMAAE